MCEFFKKYNDICLIFNVGMLLSKEAIISILGSFFVRDGQNAADIKKKNAVTGYFCYKFL